MQALVPSALSRAGCPARAHTPCSLPRAGPSAVPVPRSRCCLGCEPSSRQRLQPASATSLQQHHYGEQPPGVHPEQEEEEEWEETLESPSEEALEATRKDAKDDHDARQFAVAMARVVDEVKAQDLCVLHVAPLVSWTRYMVICTVLSRPQLLACLGRVERAAKDEWQRGKQNSPGTSPWEVLDYGSVLVHVFTPETREYFDIESFYAAAEEVELPFETEAKSTEWSTQL